MKVSGLFFYCLVLFGKFLESLKSTFTSGEFIVAFVAFSTHIFIQIASVLSKHMAVAFKIPKETTGIYFTKMFSLRGLVALSASLFTYLIKLFIDEDNIILTMTFWSLVFLARLIFIFYLHISSNPALDIYLVFILDAISVGLFQMTFYAFIAEHASVLSVSFKLSKITVFTIQMVMDFLLSDHPMTMVKIQYWFGFILTCVSTGLWFHYCIDKDKKKKEAKNNKDIESGQSKEGQQLQTTTQDVRTQGISGVNGGRTGERDGRGDRNDGKNGGGGISSISGSNSEIGNKRTESNSSLKTQISQIDEKIEEDMCKKGSKGKNGGKGDKKDISEEDMRKMMESEPGFFTHLLNAMSPLMMCIIPLMMKNILYPSLLPYGLLEREKCHKINMTITPVGLLGSSIIHIMKKTIDEINRRWKWYWHLLWLAVIPPFIIFVITFVALHTESGFSKLIINNQNVVFWMTVIFFLFHTTLESAGYMGVVSNIKHCGKVMESGKKIVSTNQLLSQITSFFFYKFAIGYNVTRKAYKAMVEINDPIVEMNWLRRTWFWIREICKGGFNDFIKDFKMNIKEYI